MLHHRFPSHYPHNSTVFTTGKLDKPTRSNWTASPRLHVIHCTTSRHFSQNINYFFVRIFTMVMLSREGLLYWWNFPYSNYSTSHRREGGDQKLSVWLVLRKNRWQGNGRFNREAVWEYERSLCWTSLIAYSTNPTRVLSSPICHHCKHAKWTLY